MPDDFRNDDKKLVERAQADSRAFGDIFEKYFTQILNFIYHRTRNKQLAHDLCSETFLKAFLNIHKFKWKGIDLSSWLYRIANNEINQHFRKNNIFLKVKKMFLLQEQSLQNIALWQSQSEIQQEQSEEFENFNKVVSCMSMLPLKYQEVLVFRYFEQKSLKEISAILNKKEGTVKSLLSRGIVKLKLKYYAT